MICSALLGDSMVQPGQDTSSPWDEALVATPGDTPTPGASSPPAPIVLGGAEGLTLNTEMQGQMPTQLSPAGGTTLTGSVGTIDSGVWEVQAGAKTEGSFWKGIGITCIFGFAIILVPMMLSIWGESRWDDNWHQEDLDIQWDAGGLNGTFQLETTQIGECDLSIYDSSGQSWDNSNGNFNAHADCDGRLIQNKFNTVVSYHGTNGSDGNFTLTIQDHYRSGDEISLQISGRNPQTGGYSSVIYGSQTLIENQTEMIFFSNESEWPSCNFEFQVSRTDGSQVRTEYLDQDYREWVNIPDCPDTTFGEWVEIVVGTIDTESGYGDLMLQEPLEEGVELGAEYWEGYDSGGGFIYDIAPCLGGLLGLVLFGVWIQRIVVNFQAGMSKTGTGMLVGVIPAFFLSMIVAFIIAVMFNF